MLGSTIFKICQVLIAPLTQTVIPTMCLMIPMQADIGPNAVRDMQAAYTIIGIQTITSYREVLKGLVMIKMLLHPRFHP